MNFFEQQDKARKRTFLLLAVYVLAVVGTIFSVYIVTRLCWYFLQLQVASRSSSDGYPVAVSFVFWDARFFFVITGIICVIVLLGTWTKIAQFSSGGAAVAKMLGGEQLMPNTTDSDERKVLNVIEEMSLASGVPVPAVFLLKNEYSINAFAAGFSMQDAVIGVTQGTVRLLSRDELQGVIAHEFSHILNGDMHLNMHLTGFLNGLLLIALTGKTILRGFRGGGRVRTSGRGGGAAVLVILLFAVLLMGVGYIGVFFCNLIKSAVSRQREFLADASSAQYTRNPVGLAGALKKIGGLSEGSFVNEAKAEEVSHFFFADGISFLGESMFPTHPPLGLRIKLLDPSFDGKYPVLRSIAPKVERGYKSRKKVVPADRKVRDWQRKASIFRMPVETMIAGAAVADQVMARVGVVTEENLDKAGRLLAEIPKSFREASITLSGAISLVYGLLIDRVDSQVRDQQLDYLSKNADPAVFQMLLRLLPDFSSLKVEFCLPLLDLATPTLKIQSPALYTIFREHIVTLIHIDKTVTVFEFALKQVVLHHLDFFFGKAKRPTPLYASVDQILPSCEILLSYLAGAGSVSRTISRGAFDNGAKELACSRPPDFVSPASLSHPKIEEALGTLAAAFPKVKERFLKACVCSVESDGKLEVREMELLRAFASTLDCPIPPFSIKV